MLVCELALRTGLTQRQIEDRFTVNEIDELLAYKNIEFRMPSKEDARHKLLSYYIVSSNLAAAGGKKAVRGLKAESFGIEWGKEPKFARNQSDLEEKLIALADICNKTKGKKK